MQTKETIQARRTIHNFLPETIEDSLIKKGLELALTAPNHRFTFPFRFYQLGPEIRNELVEVFLQTQLEKKGPPEDETAAASRRQKADEKLNNPAAIVVFVLNKKEDKYEEREDYATIACAIQNFCLALKDDGWDSKWSTGGLTRHPKTSQLLGLDPQKEEIVAFVYVGHSPIEPKPRRRPSLAEVLTETP